MSEEIKNKRSDVIEINASKLIIQRHSFFTFTFNTLEESVTMVATGWLAKGGDGNHILCFS